jgi:hypothetical protein
MVPITIVELEVTKICINGTLWDYRVTDPDPNAPLISEICLALERDPTDLYNSAAPFTVFFAQRIRILSKEKKWGPDQEELPSLTADFKSTIFII